jgi:PAS domain S-box-containing protein
MEKWQEIADILAENIGIPAALIMKTENEYMEVFISSHSANNPYQVGGKEKWHGLYCETVIKTQNKLLIPNATKDKLWDKNPDIKLGMFSYLGFPINFPDKKPFGTLCVLDNKERPFTLQHEKLMLQFKNVLELDLALLQSFELKTSQLSVDIVQEISDRKQGETILQESEKRYHDLLENIEAGIVVHAPDTSIIMNNSRASVLLGLSSDQMKGKVAIDPAWKFVFEDYTPIPYEQYPVNRIASSKKLIRNQVLGINQPGKSDIVWVMVNGFPKFNSTGDIIEIVISFSDITKHKVAEDKLRLKNYVFDVSIAALSIADINGILTEANDSFLRVWGYHDRNEVIGKPLTFFINDPDIAVAIVTALNNTGQWEGDYTARKKDGSTFIAHGFATVVKDESGKILAYQSSALDVTENKQAREALRDSELRFRNVLQDIKTVAVQGYAPDGTTTYWNKASELLYGYTAEEAIGNNLVDLIIPSEMKDDVNEAIKWMAETGQSIPSSELVLKRKDGSGVSVYSHHTIVQVSGRPQELFCIDIDLTDRMLAEKEILELNRDLELRVKQRTLELEKANKELEAFSYSVSHDLKAPLRHIIGFVELFLMNKPKGLSEKQLGYLDIISSSALDMQKLIDGILEFSKLNKIKLKKTRIRSVEMVQQVIKFFEMDIQNRNITFNVESLPEVQGDEELIQQVWTNLISNAIKYTMKKPEAVIEIGSISDDNDITFYIKDNGAGFDMEYSGKLFGAFQRLHNSSDFEGVGIGLANVNSIVTRHGGHCRAEGEVDKGATFYFSLPN